MPTKLRTKLSQCFHAQNIEIQGILTAAIELSWVGVREGGCLVAIDDYPNG